MLASGSEDGEIHHLERRRWLSRSNHLAEARVVSLDFTPDGRLVSVARDNKIRFWNHDGTGKGASVAYDALLTKVVARYDSKLAIAGDYKGRIVLWDGELSATIGPGTGKSEQRLNKAFVFNRLHQRLRADLGGVGLSI